MELQADEEDQQILLTRLKPIKGAKTNVVPSPNAYDIWFYGHASAVEHLVNTVVTIIATAGSIASIAQVLHDFVASRRRKTKAETIKGFYFGSPPAPNTSVPDGTIRIVRGKSRVEIGKKTSLEKTEAALSKFAEIGDYQSANRPLRKRLLEIQLNEAKEELASVKRTVSSYEQIVATFEKPPPLKHRWQRQKLGTYVRELRRHRAEVNSIRSRIANLERRIRLLNR
jgi:hypothetical protein